MADQHIPPSFRRGDVEPQDAIAAFIERALLQPTFNWWDVWQQEHAGAFMVAGVAELDVLQLVRELVEDALRTGRSFEDFFDAQLLARAKRGWR